jgi:TM2 domain-containing membrane protein YozV
VDTLTPQPISPALGKSEAAKAALLSALLIPGAGQLYNREWTKGGFILFTFLLASLGALIPITLVAINYYMTVAQGNLDAAAASLLPMREAWSRLVILILISILLYIYSILDAYKVRKKQESIGDRHG